MALLVTLPCEEVQRIIQIHALRKRKGLALSETVQGAKKKPVRVIDTKCELKRAELQLTTKQKKRRVEQIA